MKNKKLNEICKSSNWRPIFINGEISRYIISDTGYVLSYNNIFKLPKILKGHITDNGYRIYCLLDENKNEHWFLNHRLVALYFINIPENLLKYNIDFLEVNHKDGNKLNNDVNNLEWVTPSENLYHAYKNDLKQNCEDHYHSKYKNSDIEKVCELLEKDELSKIEISKITGVDDSTISMILSGKQWKNISKNYDFTKRKKKHTLYDDQTINKALDLLRNRDKNNLSFSEIGRIVGMSRTSIWYLNNKYFK